MQSEYGRFLLLGIRLYEARFTGALPDLSTDIRSTRSLAACKNRWSEFVCLSQSAFVAPAFGKWSALTSATLSGF